MGYIRAHPIVQESGGPAGLCLSRSMHFSIETMLRLHHREMLTGLSREHIYFILCIQKKKIYKKKKIFWGFSDFDSAI